MTQKQYNGKVMVAGFSDGMGVLNQFLNALGCDVYFARGKEQFTKILHENKPDLIFLEDHLKDGTTDVDIVNYLEQRRIEVYIVSAFKTEKVNSYLCKGTITSPTSTDDIEKIFETLFQKK